MPEFTNPFTGKIPERKLTVAELIRAVRLDLAAEEEAIHLYMAQAEAIEHPLARRVLVDVANEERQHAGEFLRLLQILAGDEDKWLAAGAAEVDKADIEVNGHKEESRVGGIEPTIGSLKE